MRQRTYRGLDAERRPADLPLILAAQAEIRAAKARHGEPIGSEPTDTERIARKRIYRCHYRGEIPFLKG